jgi:hypothetical protein
MTQWPSGNMLCVYQLEDLCAYRGHQGTPHHLHSIFLLSFLRTLRAFSVLEKHEEAQKRLLTRKQLILTTVPWDQKALLCWHEAFEFSFLMILQQAVL